MKRTLTVREVPAEVYNAIKDQAKKNHRSLQAQILWLMTKEAELDQGGFTDAARKWRKRLADRDLGDTLGEIQAGREGK